MSKPEIVLNVDVRERTGRGGARDARRNGKVPGILYGGKRGPVAIAIDKKTVSQALKSGKFISHTVTLEHKGERQLVFTQAIQFHPVTDEPHHLDLFRVEKGQMIRVPVHVRFTGEGLSPGIKRGGTLNIVRHEVELICPADQIPEELVADVADLDIGDAVKISAIKLPPNTRPTIIGRDFTVATIAGRSAKDDIIDEKPATAAVEGEVVPGAEGVEGAAAVPGAAPGAPGAAPAAGAKAAPGAAPAAGAKAAAPAKGGDDKKKK
jgi:large subunit ribosomal protein L25